MKTYSEKRPPVLEKLFLIFLAFFWFSPFLSAADTQAKAVSPILPRTVHLIFDDSGSMGDAYASWSLAGYAVQALAALLDPERDEIVVHPMTVRAPSISNRNGSMERVLAGIGRISPTGSSTPFTKVAQAAQEIGEEIGRSSGEERMYWLIIITDGDFNSDVERIGPTAEFFRKLPHTHSVFFLIGRDTSEAAQYWKDHTGSPILSAKRGEDIIPNLEKIGRMITGAGETGKSLGKWVKSGKVFEVKSELPLSRLLFVQTAEKKETLASLDETKGALKQYTYDFCEETDPGAQKRRAAQKIAGCSDGARFGRVTVLQRQGTDSIQNLTLHWDKKPWAKKSDEVSVLAEVDAILDVTIPRARAEKGGVLRVCSGDAKEVLVRIRNPHTGEILPLQHPEKLKLSSTADGLSVTFPPLFSGTPATGEFRGSVAWTSDDVTVSGKLRTHADYPGAFQLVNAMTLEIHECLSLETRILQGASEATPFEPGEGSGLPREAKSYLLTDSTDTEILARLLNRGALHEEDGNRVNPTMQRLENGRPLGGPERLPYDPAEKAWKGKLAPPPPGVFHEVKVRHGDQEESFFLFGDRKLRLTPWGENWEVPAKDLPGIDIGVSLADPGLYGDAWQVEPMDGKTLSHIRPALRKHQVSPKAGTYSWRFLPATSWYSSPCFCFSGEDTLTVRAFNKKTGEKITETLTFAVTPTSWWLRCLPFFIKFVLFSILVWWGVGIITRPRFGKRARITYTSSAGLVRVRKLAGNPVLRYLIPYRPERRQVGAVPFVASVYPSVILVSGKFVGKVEKQGGNVYFDGMEGSAHGNNRLSDHTTLEIRLDARNVDTYLFESRVRH